MWPTQTKFQSRKMTYPKAKFSAYPPKDNPHKNMWPTQTKFQENHQEHPQKPLTSLKSWNEFTNLDGKLVLMKIYKNNKPQVTPQKKPHSTPEKKQNPSIKRKMKIRIIF